MSMNLILENGEKVVDFNAAFQKAIGMRPDIQAMRRWRCFLSARPFPVSHFFKVYTKGVKSADGSKLKLEIVKVGGRVYTSVEAVQRFISAQSVMPSDEPEVAKPKLAKPDRAARAAGLRRHFPNYAG